MYKRRNIDLQKPQGENTFSSILMILRRIHTVIADHNSFLLLSLLLRPSSAQSTPITRKKIKNEKRETKKEKREKEI
jgi:hypothetical protein